MINQKNRIQWHKNNLIEKSGYVVYYMNSLKNHLSVEDRQTLYMISKYYTDGVESSRENIKLAEYYFSVGEYYQTKVPANKELLRKLISNSYGRSKSYYHYKINEYQEALEQIKLTLEINKSIKNEFPILIFDSISHYKNYLKVLITTGNIDEANHILYEIIIFLITGSTELKALNNCYEVISDAHFYEFRLFFINDFIFNYLFLNTDFQIAKKKFDKEFQNIKKHVSSYKALYTFYEIYLSEDKKNLNSFEVEFYSYFNSIPFQILTEKIN
ncbi:hypothetical protein [Flavobacterium sp.]|uniref:hypothetical protein n=1 Tax=Flavobacterium sp. TaxID=239 RepID=UPI003D0C9B2E